VVSFSLVSFPFVVSFRSPLASFRIVIVFFRRRLASCSSSASRSCRYTPRFGFFFFFCWFTFPVVPFRYFKSSIPAGSRWPRKIPIPIGSSLTKPPGRSIASETEDTGYTKFLGIQHHSYFRALRLRNLSFPPTAPIPSFLIEPHIFQICRQS
jgi:hypothetical protein